MRAGGMWLLLLWLFLSELRPSQECYWGEVLTQFSYMPAFGVATATVMQSSSSLVGEDDWAEWRQTFGYLFSSCCPLDAYLCSWDTTKLPPTPVILRLLRPAFGDALFSPGDSYDNRNGHYTAVWGLGMLSSPFMRQYPNVVYPYQDRLPDGSILGWGLPEYLGWNAFWIMVSVGSSYAIIIKLIWLRKDRKCKQLFVGIWMELCWTLWSVWRDRRNLSSVFHSL